MKPHILLPLLALSGALLPTAASAAPKPKLTMAQARAIALKRAPGAIKDAEYEHEGRGWRFSFDILQGKRIHEIGVDAMTGAIVEDKYEALDSKD
ncbi:peptidase M4 [Sphingomonas panacisoli]|uniref:Peptidase M4 n=1 Tax=Sphingomonas panacisoli TaxID=1813879 RepID=A0A5B8LIZ6_9SPHN|nr:PepSY domain-containing protein [Sphingomonas panacisoli]QDZ07916.1 peptidase M4 [Sphingomonas panacisoli]